MAFCLYLRKSRADLEAEARGEGETLARHEKALLELARRQRLNITQIYREIGSGETIAARPVMRQLLSEVERGVWNGVLVMEVERLARGDTIDQGIVAQAFQFSNTKIITPMKTYDPANEYDEEYFEFGLFMSRREYKTINRRLQLGRVASVKEGKYVGNKTPYGYIRKKLEHDKGFTLEPDPDTSSIVELIFDLYAHGEQTSDGKRMSMGVSRIVRKLNDLKISPQKGDHWATATLQQMLRNPVYIGKIRWNSRPVRKKIVDGKMVQVRPRMKPEDWVLTEGLHRPLIDWETWNAVQQKLHKNPSHPVPKNKKVKNPLAGLVICGKCGRRMVRRPYTNRGTPDTLMCPVTSCDNISTALYLVEDRVLKALQQWLSQYRLTYGQKGEASGQSEKKKNALQAVQGELKKLEKQKDRIYDLLEQGVYSREVFLQRTQGVREKIKQTQKSIEQLILEIEGEKKTGQIGITIIPQAEYVLAEYPKAQTAAEKNELLKSVIEKVIYTKNVNGRWHAEPDDFELILYPKLPKQGESADQYS